MCQGHIMFALEGGYHLAALACSVQACLEALLGESFSPDTLGAGPQPPPPNIDTTLEAVKRTHGLE
jgi:acetoin utilization deacetylase AcuC-like enzyme